jgi:hypothetical protein
MIDEQPLIQLVADSTATSPDGEHLLVHSIYHRFIRMDGAIRSVQQAIAMLSTGEWGAVVPTCGVADCVRPDHMEAADLALVARKTTTRASLADLYRKAKGRGLLTAQTEYGG